MTKNTDLFAFWRHWGIIFKKVERQGKGAQNLCIEPNNLPPNFWVPGMTLKEETRLSKLKISQNYPYFTLFYLKEFLSLKLVKYWSFESGYFKSLTTTGFGKKFPYFSRKWFLECPFFFEKTIHRGASKK